VFRIAGGVARRATVGKIGDWSVAGANNERINIAGVVNFPSFKRIKENAITATQHCLITKTIGESDARRERLFRTVRWIRPAAIPVEPVAIGSNRTAKALHTRSAQSFIGIAQA